LTIAKIYYNVILGSKDFDVFSSLQKITRQESQVTQAAKHVHGAGRYKSFVMRYYVQMLFSFADEQGEVTKRSAKKIFSVWIALTSEEFLDT
jgi:hypothetical protein